MVTGDSVPVRKQVIKLVEEVQGTKVLIQDFAERITRIFVPIGTVTDIAIESGDIVLVKGDLVGVVKAIKLSKETFRKIRENLFWAFFYNIISIPMASLGFLHPIIAEITMAFSSINVITNSLRLRRIKL
jgi:Cu+-exporting ATPase